MVVRFVLSFIPNFQFLEKVGAFSLGLLWFFSCHFNLSPRLKQAFGYFASLLHLTIALNVFLANIFRQLAQHHCR